MFLLISTEVFFCIYCLFVSYLSIYIVIFSCSDILPPIDDLNTLPVLPFLSEHHMPNDCVECRANYGSLRNDGTHRDYVQSRLAERGS